jgi:signal transduction histidine kinase
MMNGGIFTVSTKASKQTVMMTFSDTGSGIPKELGEKIFEPYFTHGKRGGVGLGLSIARRIVQDHRGTIEFESGKKGTTFFITIPR